MWMAGFLDILLTNGGKEGLDSKLSRDLHVNITAAVGD